MLNIEQKSDSSGNKESLNANHLRAKEVFQRYSVVKKISMEGNKIYFQKSALSIENYKVEEGGKN